MPEIIRVTSYGTLEAAVGSTRDCETCGENTTYMRLYARVASACKDGSTIGRPYHAWAHDPGVRCRVKITNWTKEEK